MKFGLTFQGHGK